MIYGGMHLISSRSLSGLTRALSGFQKQLKPTLSTAKQATLVPRLTYHPGQKQIADSPAKYKVVACGRKFGKTEFGVDQIVETALDGYPVAYFAPSYKAASAVWRELKKTVKPVTVRKLEGERSIELVTGGVIDVWSFHNMAAESSRPRSYKKIVIDEAALGSMDLWMLIILPMLAVYGGDAIFLSTPRGVLNWFYELFKWGVEKRDGWQSFQMPTSKNPHIPQASIDDARAQMPEDEFAQEYLAEFKTVAGAVYPTFREATSDGSPGNVTMEADYIPAYPVYWSVDDGYTNPRVIAFWQERPMFGIEGCIVLFDLRYETQELAEYAIDEALKLPTEDNPYPRPKMIYHDPSAPEFAGHCNKKGLATYGAFNGIHEGIKVVRRFILDGNGVRRFYIHPRCRPAIDEMMGYHFPDGDRITTGSGDPKPVDKDNHFCDAARYFIATRHFND